MFRPSGDLLSRDQGRVSEAKPCTIHGVGDLRVSAREWPSGEVEVEDRLLPGGWLLERGWRITGPRGEVLCEPNDSSKASTGWSCQVVYFDSIPHVSCEDSLYIRNWIADMYPDHGCTENRHNSRIASLLYKGNDAGYFSERDALFASVRALQSLSSLFSPSVRILGEHRPDFDSVCSSSVESIVLNYVEIYSLTPAQVNVAWDNSSSVNDFIFELQSGCSGISNRLSCSEELFGARRESFDNICLQNENVYKIVSNYFRCKDPFNHAYFCSAWDDSDSVSDFLNSLQFFDQNKVCGVTAQPAAVEIDEHLLTHRPPRPGCAACDEAELRFSNSTRNSSQYKAYRNPEHITWHGKIKAPRTIRTKFLLSSGETVERVDHNAERYRVLDSTCIKKDGSLAHWDDVVHRSTYDLASEQLLEATHVSGERASSSGAYIEDGRCVIALDYIVNWPVASLGKTCVLLFTRLEDRAFYAVPLASRNEDDFKLALHEARCEFGLIESRRPYLLKGDREAVWSTSQLIKKYFTDTEGDFALGVSRRSDCNAAAEAFNRVLLRDIFAQLRQASAPLHAWADALNVAFVNSNKAKKIAQQRNTVARAIPFGLMGRVKLPRETYKPPRGSGTTIISFMSYDLHSSGGINIVFYDVHKRCLRRTNILERDVRWSTEFLYSRTREDYTEYERVNIKMAPVEIETIPHSDPDSIDWIRCDRCDRWRICSKEQYAIVRDMEKVYCSTIGLSCSAPEDQEVISELAACARASHCIPDTHLPCSVAPAKDCTIEVRCRFAVTDKHIRVARIRAARSVMAASHDLFGQEPSSIPEDLRLALMAHSCPGPELLSFAARHEEGNSNEKLVLALQITCEAGVTSTRRSFDAQLSPDLQTLHDMCSRGDQHGINSLLSDMIVSCSTNVLPKEGLSRTNPDYGRWVEACHKELRGLLERGVVRLVSPSEVSQCDEILPCLVVLTRKQDGTFKSRIVACGNFQKVLTSETYAGVISHDAWLSLVALMVASRRFEMVSVDVSQAFLQTEERDQNSSRKRTFLRLPKVLREHVPELDGSLFELLRAIYGERTAPKGWYHTLARFLMDELGFARSSYDDALFFKGETVIFTHVDDIPMLGPRSELDQYVCALRAKFDCTPPVWLSECSRSTPLVFVAHELFIENGDLVISQTRYADAVLETHQYGGGWTKTSGLRKEMFDREVLYRDGLAQLSSDDLRKFRSILGAVGYLAQHSRADLSAAVGILAEGQSDGTEAHLQLANDLLRYLANRTNYELRYSISSADLEHNSIELVADFDAAFLKDHRARTGVAIFLNNCLVHWISVRQKTVSLSTAESELLAATRGAREVLGLKNLLAEIFKSRDVKCTLRGDNTAANLMANRQCSIRKVRHLTLPELFIREATNDGRLLVESVSTQNNRSNNLTKVLGELEAERARDMVGLKRPLN